MGRYRWDKKQTVESANQLSIFKLNGWGFLQDGAGGTLSWTRSLTGEKSTVGISVDMGEEPNIRLYYTATKSDGETIDSDYRIGLTWTACRYGGKRFWFSCPGCQNRVGILYLAGGSVRFQCRGCSDLTYDSRNELRLSRCPPMDWEMYLDAVLQRLHEKVKRWTYAGRPTKKAQKYHRYENLYNRITGRG
jgi:hypothetical protein